MEPLNRDYQQLGTLGRGGFANVYLAQKNSGRKVALKIFTWPSGVDDNTTRRRLNQNGDGDDESDDDPRSEKEIKMAAYERELDAVLQLDDDDDSSNNRNRTQRHGGSLKRHEMSIIFFEDWFEGPNYACIVMKYADGGTLAQEIVRKAASESFEPYTERRIAWYLLQICDALQFAHQKGVAHMDVKSANILIDKSCGGHQLILTDWGSSCILDVPNPVPTFWRRTMAGTSSPIESMTELYASPELQRAYNQGCFVGLAPIPVDAFALGCILYELLCCKKMYDLTERDNETLGEFIGRSNSASAALSSPCLQLHFEEDNAGDNSNDIGYSKALKDIIGSLLDPNPSSRFSPSRLFGPLQTSSLSPLLSDIVSAAQNSSPGTPVTIDNVQLGMFVQRGRDWSDNDNDGGIGNVGVITRLDPDGNYTEATFPIVHPGFRPGASRLTCRIGANAKYELQVGPPSAANFTSPTGAVSTSMDHGIVTYTSSLPLSKGLVISDGKYMVMAVDSGGKYFIVAPLIKCSTPSSNFSPSSIFFQQMLTQQDLSPMLGEDALPSLMQPPLTWVQQETSRSSPVQLLDVTDPLERNDVIEQFHAVDTGLDITAYEVTQIRRVQSIDMWRAYTQYRSIVRPQNWGINNERRLFHGTLHYDPIRELSDRLSLPPTFFRKMSSGIFSRPEEVVFTSSTKLAQQWAYCSREGPEAVYSIVLCRVELGRVKDHRYGRQENEEGQTFHSSQTSGSLRSDRYGVLDPRQAYPEYIVTYKSLSAGFTPLVGRSAGSGRSLNQSATITNSSSSTATTTGIPLFGTATTPVTGISLFGTGATTPATGSFLFGTAATTPATGIPSFGTEPVALNSATSRFGSGSVRPNSSLLFGSNQLGGTTVRSTASPNAGGRTLSATPAVPPASSNETSKASTATTSSDKKSSDENDSKASPAKVKECVVCMERPVTHILVPCGHPCLCEVCSTSQGLSRLKSKCPECRVKFREAIRFWGKVVET